MTVRSVPPAALLGAYAVTGGVGVLAYAMTLRLPWLDDEFHLGEGLRWVLVAAGVAILVVAWRARRLGMIAVAVPVLGVSVLIYPTFLTLSAAGVGAAFVETLGSAGHVLPLTMVQLIPVLASGTTTGRPCRAWVGAILGVAAVGAAMSGLGLALSPPAGLLLALSTILWFVSFALAPIACWTMVRGTVGRARRRGIVAGLAALVPVLIILWCTALGGLGAALALSEAELATALFLGFAAATVACAILATAACGKGDSLVLRRSVVIGLLRGSVVAVVALLASGASLASIKLLPTPSAAVLVAVALTVLLGWGAVRLFGWAADVVDPGAEFRLELDQAAALVEGQHCRIAENVARRLAEDESLVLAFAVGEGAWVDAAGDTVLDGSEAPAAGRAVVLASEAGRAVVLLLTDNVAARDHARAWGEGDRVLRPALMEARQEWQADRAALAADQERIRLQQDLHDGLQGRLLGLALNLQISERDIEDPVARLAIAETVDGLRGAVQDVRAMAGGRLPQLLVDNGLGSALGVLLQPVRARIGSFDLAPDLVSCRPPAGVEACAYFVVGEAVGNAIKHAECARIDVSLRRRDPRTMVVRVSDDGCGGADVRLGSGLRGLAARVESHGGLLLVSDSESGGTLVEAVLPCGS